MLDLNSRGDDLATQPVGRLLHRRLRNVDDDFGLLAARARPASRNTKEAQKGNSRGSPKQRRQSYLRVGFLLALSKYGRFGDSIFVHRTNYCRLLQGTGSRDNLRKRDASLHIQHGTTLRATILSRTARLRSQKIQRRE